MRIRWLRRMSLVMLLALVTAALPREQGAQEPAPPPGGDPNRPVWNARVSYEARGEPPGGHYELSALRLSAEYQVTPLGLPANATIHYSAHGFHAVPGTPRWQRWSVPNAITFKSFEELQTQIVQGKGQGKALGDGGYLHILVLPTVLIYYRAGERVFMSGEWGALEFHVTYPDYLTDSTGHKHDLHLSINAREKEPTPERDVSEAQEEARAMKKAERILKKLQEGKTAEVVEEARKELDIGTERSGAVELTGTELQGKVVQGSRQWTDPPGGEPTYTHTVSWHFSLIPEETTVKIVKPEPDSKHIFGSKFLTILEIEAEAKVEPAKYAKEVEWEVEDIQGSKRTIKPAKGTKVTIRFEKLPEKNEQFGPKKITAKVRGKQDQVTVKVFFKRDEFDNPESWGRTSGVVPNWFYYWKQTGAAQGHREAIRYDPNCKAEKAGEKGHTYGYFAGYDPDNPDVEHIYICDLAKNNFRVRNPVSNKIYEGIDGFGVVVRHEWAHKVFFEDWWGPRGMYREGFDEKSRATKESHDVDYDRIPDAVEESGGTFTHPLKRDSRGLGYDDEEYLAFDAMDGWTVGSADREDWACPGKQCKDR